MQPKIIGMRVLRQHLATITRAAERGQSFLVTVHKRAAFRIEPPKKQKRNKAIGQKLIDTFKDVMFHSGETDLSRQIDEIVYYDRR